MGSDHQGKGSLLLGKELRSRRGHRSLKEIERLTKSPPLAGRVSAISASALNNIERGLQLPSLPTLRTLSYVYSVSQSHLLNQVELERLSLDKPQGDDLAEMRERVDTAILEGDYQMGFAAALRCEELATLARDRAHARGNKALCLSRLGMLEESAHEFTRLLGEPGIGLENQVKALQNLAEVYVAMGNSFAAMMAAEKGLDLAQKADMRFQIAVLHNTLGNVKLDSYQMDETLGIGYVREALRHYEKSMSLLEALGRSAEVVATKVNIGTAHILQDSFLLGFKYLREALKESRAEGARLYIGYALKELGRAFLLAGNTAAARNHLLECDRLAANMGHVDLQFMSYYYLLEADRAEGKESTYSFKRCLSLRSHLESRPPELQKFEQFLQARGERGMTA